jgi:hypothetical protein
MHKIRNFHEGHNTVREWQDSGRRMAWEQHHMCESAFKVLELEGQDRSVCL